MVWKRMSVSAVVLMASVLMSQTAFAIPSAADSPDDSVACRWKRSTPS
jgi:hypothetical protein